MLEGIQEGSAMGTAQPGRKSSIRSTAPKPIISLQKENKRRRRRR
jgi:hypothetical protein